MLILHILIALSSIFYTGFTYISPSKKKINISYMLILSTIGSGTYLIILNQSHMISACITGIIYLGVVSVGILFAKKKLLLQKKAKQII